MRHRRKRKQNQNAIQLKSIINQNAQLKYDILSLSKRDEDLHAIVKGLSDYCKEKLNLNIETGLRKIIVNNEENNLYNKNSKKVIKIFSLILGIFFSIAFLGALIVGFQDKSQFSSVVYWVAFVMCFLYLLLFWVLHVCVRRNKTVIKYGLWFTFATTVLSFLASSITIILLLSKGL